MDDPNNIQAQKRIFTTPQGLAALHVGIMRYPLKVLSNVTNVMLRFLKTEAVPSQFEIRSHFFVSLFFANFNLFSSIKSIHMILYGYRQKGPHNLPRSIAVFSQIYPLFQTFFTTLDAVVQ